MENGKYSISSDGYCIELERIASDVLSPSGNLAKQPFCELALYRPYGNSYQKNKCHEPDCLQTTQYGMYGNMASQTLDLTFLKVKYCVVCKQSCS